MTVYACVPAPKVLTKAVKPPTPDAAKLAAVVSQQALAMQHVRMQLARLVKRAHPAQVRQEAQTYTHMFTHTHTLDWEGLRLIPVVWFISEAHS